MGTDVYAAATSRVHAVLPRSPRRRPLHPVRLHYLLWQLRKERLSAAGYRAGHDRGSWCVLKSAGWHVSGRTRPTRWQGPVRIGVAYRGASRTCANHPRWRSCRGSSRRGRVGGLLRPPHSQASRFRQRLSNWCRCCRPSSSSGLIHTRTRHRTIRGCRITRSSRRDVPHGGHSFASAPLMAGQHHLADVGRSVAVFLGSDLPAGRRPVDDGQRPAGECRHWHIVSLTFDDANADAAAQAPQVQGDGRTLP